MWVRVRANKRGRWRKKEKKDKLIQKEEFEIMWRELSLSFSVLCI